MDLSVHPIQMGDFFVEKIIRAFLFDTVFSTIAIAAKYD
jgi:hypothetical protein